MLSRVKRAAKDGSKKLYSRCPPSMQEVLLAANSYVRSFQKYGREFRSCWELVQRSQWYSAAELHELQAERLRALIAHAYATVPYYRSVFEQRRLRPDDVRGPADLEKLPILTKDDVRDHFDELISTRSSRLRGHMVGTSGTPGTPLHVLLDRRREAMETALGLRQLGWAGFRRGEKKAVFRGLEIPNAKHGDSFYCRFDRRENALHFSSAHISARTLPGVIEALRHFRPALVWGYPSTVHTVASYLRSRGEPAGLNLKAISLSSEPLYDWQRRDVEEAFETRVFDWYGLSEGVISFCECEYHDGYHVNAESGILEFLPTPDVSGITEIVGTGLDNYLMPLIRYRTGDIGGPLEKICRCGRGLPLVAQVQTKKDDIVVTPDGRWISPSVLTFPFKSIHGIEKSQLVQRGLDELVVRLAVRDGYSQDQEKALMSGLQARLGPEVKITVDYVDDIPRTTAGKYRWVVSEVANQSE